MPQIKIALFGPPRIELDGQVLEIKLRKALALVAYLAATSQSFSREKIATLLWPENSSRSSRSSLRRLLYDIKQASEPTLLTVTQSEISINHELSLHLDIEQFRTLVSASLPSVTEDVQLSDQAAQDLQAAVELYTQEFLAGFSLPDSPEFDDWQFFQREELSQQLSQSLLVLLSHLEQGGEYERAASFARRRLTIDPLDESAQRDLIRLYALAGQRSAALRQFNESVRILDEELGVPPEDETVRLHAAIQSREFPSQQTKDRPLLRTSADVVQAPLADRSQVGSAAPPPDSDQVSAGHEGGTPARSQTSLPPSAQTRLNKQPPDHLPPPHNLPNHTIPFVGREWELDEIAGKLMEPSCRLLTLVGPGGMGKTRLALAVADKLLQLSKETVPTDSQEQGQGDGIYFVPLAAVEETENIVTAIGDAIGYTFAGERSPQAQLFDYLQNKQMLLILDNFEHLLDDVEIVADIHAATPKSKLLVTSRETLNLYEEWFHPLNGLAYPDAEATLTAAGETPESYAQWRQDVQNSDAAQLFAQSASRAKADFDLEAELPSVARICRLVDGVPLALELSAAWLRVLSCQEIADEIESGLDILTTRHRNIAARHRSMRAVLEQSWEMLDPSEQAIFELFSLFHNGFTSSAAQTVAKASLPMLASLADKSFIRLQGNRYQIHELLRQFAIEKSTEKSAEKSTESTRDSTMASDALALNMLADATHRYANYYMSLLMSKEGALFGPEPLVTVEELRPELDNIRHAWQSAGADQDIALLDSAIAPLCELYEYLGLTAQATSLFANVAEQLETQASQSSGDPSPELNSLLCRLYANALLFTLFSSSLSGSDVLRERAIFHSERCQLPLGRAEVKYALLYENFHYGLYDSAVDHGEEALALFRSEGNWQRTIDTLNILAESNGRNGQGEQALAHLDESLKIASENRYLRGQAIATSHLGVVHFFGSQLEQSRSYFEQAIEFLEKIQDLSRASATANNLAWVHLYIGDYSEALEAAQRALQWHNKASSVLIEEELYDTIGEINYALGDYERARNAFTKANDLALHSERKRYRPASLANIALIDIAQSAYDSAQQRIKEAHQVLGDNIEAAIQARVFEAEGWLNAALGQEVEAITAIQHAWKVLEEAGDELDLAQTFVLAGEIFQQFGQKSEAISALKKGLTLAQRTGRKSVANKAQLLLKKSEGAA